MTLLDHLRASGETVPDFAVRIAEPRGTIHKIAYRQRQPSLTLALKISDATGGEVQPSDLALPEPSPTPTAARAA